ncbi:MAG: 30S ribosomal protein S20 [Tepidisphaeraceae bacterium]
MAHSISAKKRVRQNARRRARNRARKDVLKDAIKTFNTALSGGDVKKAETEFRNTTRRLDKIAAKGTIHKKTAARKRSRLAKRLNAAKAGGGAPSATAKA